MSILSGKLNQKATIWIPGPRDIFNNPTWSGPQVIDVRWQQHQQEITNFEGQRVISQAVIYTEAEVPFGARLAQGEHYEPDPLADTVTYPSWAPQAIADMVGLDGAVNGRKVWL